MKRTVLFVIIFCIVLSCDKYPDPSVDSLSNYTFEFQTGQAMKFAAGDLISDNIVFKATNTINPAESRVKVLFDIVKGDGNISEQSVYTDDNGYTSLSWKSGIGSSEQILRANSYDPGGKYLASTDLVAYGFRDDEWDTFSGYPEGSITGMAADTINKITYIVAYQQLYKQGDKYYIWNPVYDALLNSPSSINIDRNGILYATIVNGDLIKSTDHGQSWSLCTRPYPESTSYLFVQITRDNYIWVSAMNQKVRYSKDGGGSWTDIGSGMTAGFEDIFRLKDGSLIYHGTDCCSLYRSTDETLTWTKLDAPDYSAKLYVTDNDEISILSQRNGIYIYSSTDYGTTFTQVYNLPYNWYSSFNNTFTRWGSTYYVLIPGEGILSSYDLVHFDMYWYNTQLTGIFIDHNGVLIAKDVNQGTIYYRKNSVKK